MLKPEFQIWTCVIPKIPFDSALHTLKYSREKEDLCLSHLKENEKD